MHVFADEVLPVSPRAWVCGGYPGRGYVVKVAAGRFIYDVYGGTRDECAAAVADFLSVLK